MDVHKQQSIQSKSQNTGTIAKIAVYINNGQCGGCGGVESTGMKIYRVRDMTT